MSYDMHPYAVSLAALKKAIGSRDAKLAAELQAKFERRLASIDGIDVAVRSTRDALDDLIHGRKPDADAGFKYGYCLKFLCEHFGRALTNDAWSSMRWSWFEQVDGELKRAGVEAKVFGSESHLGNRGAPVPLPKIADFPSIGYLLAGEVGRVTMELEKTKRAKIDEEVEESLAQVRSWLDHCARTHTDLLCFYH